MDLSPVAVDVFLFTSVGGPMHKLQPVLIYPDGSHLQPIFDAILPLRSTVHNGTIRELTDIYHATLRSFLSWVAIPEGSTSPQRTSDSDGPMRLGGPYDAKQFYKYLRENPSRKTAILVDLMTQQEYDWKLRLQDFCGAFDISSEDEKALIKLRMEPGNEEFCILSREEWQGFGGLSETAYHSLVKYNHLYAHGLHNANAAQ